MYLSNYYESIKSDCLSGLQSKGKTESDLKATFNEARAKLGFNRACVYVGCQLNKFWVNKLHSETLINLKDHHIHTLYRKMFEELEY